MMLDDPDLLDQVRTSLIRGASAEAGWTQAIEAAAARLEALPRAVFKARAADVRDVGERVLRRLLGVGGPPALPDSPVVLLAEDLTPSDTVRFGGAQIVAMGTAGGGPTSHAAILARRLGVPAVVGLGPSLLSVAAGVQLLIDGDAGIVIAEPDETALASARARQATGVARRATGERTAGDQAVTLDGVPIEIAANVGSLADAEAAARHGADGIGLFRTEFLYLDRATEPTEEEQVSAYHSIIERLGGKSVVIRTLDVGGDKPLPYLRVPPEPNPFLGLRAIRLARRHLSLLRTQLRAILRAGAGYPIRVMFPMVATVEEMQWLRQTVDAVRIEIEREGLRGPADLQVGMMVEVPSAALLSRAFLPWVDFFSVGTNDLAQYTLAADRTNAAVAALADGLHPAVLRLIGMVAEAARSGGKWAGVCGELAAETAAVPILVGLGVSELSVNPLSVPAVKEIVRQCTMGQARAVASQAVQLHSAQSVRDLAGAALREP
jgi:phosphoenolpyruvate-protein phosphotransferase